MEGNKLKNRLSQKLIKIVNRALEEGSDRKECVTKPEIWPEFNPQNSHAENWPANCLQPLPQQHKKVQFKIFKGC